MTAHPESAEQARQMAEAVNSQAANWMKRGIVLLNENTRSSVKQSLQCFDRALELFGNLPLTGNLDFRHNLAACRLNRADALTRLGDSENLVEALNDYGQAIALLRRPPPDEDPLHRRRLAAAWLKRGITLALLETPRSTTEAVTSFAQSAEVLRAAPALNDSESRRLLGCALMNHAHALFQSAGPSAANAARTSANEAVMLLADLEESDLLAAEAAFKARHVLCQALAHLLSDASASKSVREQLVSEATDVVDAGMERARHWEQRGVNGFRPLACDLFQFGSRVYQKHQPHFLADFLLESLDPTRTPGAIPDSQEMHAAAVTALRRALEQIQRDSFAALNTPRHQRTLEILQELRVTEARLVELRQLHLTA